MADRFRERAPGVMKLLMADFDLDKESAAAILGNLGGESRLEAVQEGVPISGRGGFGWAQWTGSRRVAFEAYCSRNGLDVRSDKANYAYLFVELKGPEARSIQMVKNAQGLENKTTAFEQVFERAGIKNYEGRIRYAKIALDAYEKSLELSPATKAAVAITTVSAVASAPVAASKASYSNTQVATGSIMLAMAVVIVVLYSKLKEKSNG